MTTEALFHELSYYTLAQRGEEFIHQYAVDAYGAQSASTSDKPIRLVFALVGLYLHVELGCNGRQVQHVHTRLAQRKHALPRISIPESRGAISVADVLDVPPGQRRDRKIDEWCGSVWAAYSHNREAITGLLGELASEND